MHLMIIALLLGFGTASLLFLHFLIIFIRISLVSKCMTCVHSYIPKSERFSRIQEDRCPLLFTPRHLPFSRLSVVTLQDSTKGNSRWWVWFWSQCFWDIKIDDVKSNISPHIPPAKIFFPMWLILKKREIRKESQLTSGRTHINYFKLSSIQLCLHQLCYLSASICPVFEPLKTFPLSQW